MHHVTTVMNAQTGRQDFLLSLDTNAVCQLQGALTLLNRIASTGHVDPKVRLRIPEAQFFQDLADKIAQLRNAPERK